MMYGTQERFEYFQCSKCKALQIVTAPRNLAKYYPQDYYSISFKEPKVSIIKTFIKALLFKIPLLLRNEKLYQNISKIIYKIIDGSIANIIFYSKATNQSRILDVGCGNGNLLWHLCELGYTKTIGIDPYVQDDIVYQNGVKVYKNNLENYISKANIPQFDLIMFNHSLEHVETSHIETLILASKMLSKNGLILLRLPTVSSHAWEKYREAWFNLDAPRHIILHSIESIDYICKKSGLNIIKKYYESGAMQFFGSELYQRNIPFLDEQGHPQDLNKFFSKKELQRFQKDSEKLNKEEKGDWISIICQKK